METYITKNETFYGMKSGHGIGFSFDQKGDHPDRLSQGEKLSINRHEIKS